MQSKGKSSFSDKKELMKWTSTYYGRSKSPNLGRKSGYLELYTEYNGECSRSETHRLNSTPEFESTSCTTSEQRCKVEVVVG